MSLDPEFSIWNVLSTGSPTVVVPKSSGLLPLPLGSLGMVVMPSSTVSTGGGGSTVPPIYHALTVAAEQGVLSADSDADGDVLTAQLVTSVAHGTLSLAADGSFVYAPAAGFTGNDQFTYLPSDGLATGNLTTVTIAVTNAAPIAFPVSYRVAHDRALDVPAARGALSVDVDPDHDPFTASLVMTPAHGTLTFNGDGSFDYQPAAGFVGADQFTFTISDGLVTSTPVTATINVSDQAPLAANDVYEMLHDTTLTVQAVGGLLANDTDADRDPLTVSLYGAPSGTLTLNADGSFSFTPPARFSGSARFQYRDFDGAEWSSPATVTIQVDNPPPVAQNDAFSILHDTTLTASAATSTGSEARGVLANDYSFDGSALTAVLDTTVAHGSLTLNADGSFSYTPTAGFVGSDSFSYHDTTPYGVSASATVTLTVTNDVPTVADQSYSVLHDRALTVDATSGVLAGALDSDGDALTAVLLTLPSHGTLTLHADGSFSYVPAAGFLGSDSFTFAADDGALDSDAGTVTIAVTDTTPTAGDETFTVNHDQTLTVSAAAGLLAGASDPDVGDTLTAQLVHPANNGTVTVHADGSFSYVPDAGFTGGDSFAFDVSDGRLASNTATVTISVAETPPVSTDKSYSVVHDHTLTVAGAAGVLAGDSDAEGDPLSAMLVSCSSDGTLTFNSDGSFSYVPQAGFVGIDGFSYRASDGIETGAITNVTINVTVQAPTAGSVSYTVAQNQMLSVSSGDLLSAANDLDGDAITAQLVTGPSHGTLTLQPNGNFSYMPDATFAGTDSFTFVANDGIEQSATATATISVTHVAELPTPAPESFSVHAGGTLSDNVLTGINVPNGDALTAAVATQPGAGTLTLASDGSFSYVPNATFVGSDTFSFTIANGTASTAAIGVTVYVTNAAPTAAAAHYVAYLTTPLTVSAAQGVLVNASDPDGDKLMASVVSGPSNGTLSLNADGSFTYSATAGFTGADSFVYSAADPFGASASATVNITVTADTVIANDDSFSVVHDRTFTATAVNGVLRNDWAVDGGALTAQVVTSPAHGTLTLNSDGAFSYVPAAGFTGSDSFTYQALEGSTASAPAIVTLAVNDKPPVTAPDNYTVLHDHPLTVAVNRGVLANDYSDEGDTLTASVVTAPADGSLTLHADGSFSYIPNAGFVGTDGFTYTAGDGASASAPTAVTIDVTDQAPVGQGTAYHVHHGQSLSVAAPGVLAFDYDPDGDPLTMTVTSTTAHGTLVLNHDGSFSYTPTPLAGGRDFVGTDSFTYTLSDGALTSDPITVSISVDDEVPQANADYFTVHAGAAFSGNVLANDVDADGDTLKAVPVSLPAGITLDAQGNLSVPATMAVGSYTTTYEADDNGLYSSVAVVTIDVTDNGPVAVPAEFTTQYGQPLAGANVLANDFSPDGLTLTAVLVSSPAHSDGNFSLAANGDVQYTPAPGFSGTDTFTYRATDGILSSAVVTVTIDVTEDPPAAVGVFLQTSLNTPVSGNVLRNAVNPDGATLTVTLATQPADGMVALNADGSFTYTPNHNYSGSDSFDYTLSDGVTSSTGTVTIAIEAWQVQAEDANYRVDLGAGTLQVAAPGVLANDTTGGPSMTAQLVGGPEHGTLTLNTDGSFTYTPAAAFVGTDSFTYNAVLPDGTTSEATVKIDVTKSPPVTAAGSLSDVAGQTASVTIASLLSGATDEGGTIDPTTFAIVSQPYHGTATIGTVNGQRAVIYTPNAGFSGSDLFYYTVADNTSQTAAASQVAITVAAADSVVADDVASSAAQDTVQTIDVLAAVTIDGQPAEGMSGVTVTCGVPAGEGATVGSATVNASNQIVFTPSAGWSGDGSFAYTVTDAAGTQASGTIHVRATAVDLPTGGDLSESGTENQLLTFHLAGTWRYAEVTSPPTHGTLTNFANGSFTYSPDLNYAGEDSFQYAAYDKDWNKVTGTITLSVAQGTDILLPSGPGPAPKFQGTPTYGDGSSDSQNPVVILPDQEYLNASAGVETINYSGVQIVSDIVGDTDYLTPLGVSDGMGVWVMGLRGYENAEWLGSYGKHFTMVTNGSEVGDMSSPDTSFYVMAGNNVGSITGTDVDVEGGFDVGKIVASGDVSVSTNGVLAGIMAGGNISYADAQGGITGAIIAGGDIGYVAAYNLNGMVMSIKGNIGFGDSSGLYYDVDVGNLLSGSVIAEAGSIENVQANSITSSQIYAGQNIGTVSSVQSLPGTSITAEAGSIGNVECWDSILGASIKAGGDINGIDGIIALRTISGTIEAGGNIASITAGDSINAEISAGGDIGTISTQHYVAYLDMFEGLAQDISGTITCGGTIHQLFAGGDLTATVATGGLDWAKAGRDITAAITATGNIGTVWAGHTLSQPVSGYSIDMANAGYDITSAANIEAKQGGITVVTAGHNLAGNVKAKGDVMVVAAGYVPMNSTFYNTEDESLGWLDMATSAGTITSQTISAGGNLWQVSAYGAVGMGGGTIAGTAISAGGNINVLWTTGNFNAAITAGGSINLVQAGQSIGDEWPITCGGDLTGSISAGTSIYSVRAFSSPFAPSVGSIDSTIIAGTNIIWLAADLDIGGNVTAQQTIGQPGGIVSAGRDISGNLTAVNGDIISSVTAGRNISGSLTAGQDISYVSAGGDISGNITAGAQPPSAVGGGGSGGGGIGSPLPPGEGQGGGSGSANAPPPVTAGIGNIAGVTAGLSDSGGNISGAITAGASIGNVIAWGPKLLKDIATNFTPAGLIGTGLEWWLSINQATDTYTVDKPTGEPQAETGGNISGAISAGTTLGTVTAFGTISGSIEAGETIAPVWALGDISGNVTAGTAITAGGDINSLWTTGNCNAAITAGTSIYSVQAGQSIGDGWPITDGGDLSGSITAGTSIYVIRALSSPFAPDSGSIESTVTAGTDITRLMADLDIGGNVTAQHSIGPQPGGLISVGRDISGNLTAVSGDIATPITAGRNISGNLTAGHDISFVSAGGDATINALGDISAGVTVSAGWDAQVSTLGNASNLTVTGCTSADVWAGGSLSASITSTLGDVTVYAMGDAIVGVSAGTSATLESLGNMQVAVTSGTTSALFAMGNLSGTVQAGSDAALASGGNLSAALNAGGDASLAAIGDLTSTVSAGNDISAGAYGNLNSSSFYAGHDIALLWARGDLTGNYSAANSIDEVDCYGMINASLMAPNIGTVAAFGPIDGSLNASSAITAVESDGPIGAALNSPNVGSFVENGHGIFTDWPATPVLDDSADIARLSAAQAGLEALAGQIANDKTATSLNVGAAETAAAPLFAVSIGDPEAAAAAFTSAGNLLASLIIVAQGKAQSAITSDQTQLSAYFRSEDRRLANAKDAAQKLIFSVDDDITSLTAVRTQDANVDFALADQLLAAVKTARTSYLNRLDTIRDVEWPNIFLHDVKEVLLDRVQTVIDIGGIFDNSGVLDAFNAGMYAGRGRWIDAAISALGVVPILVLDGLKGLRGVPRVAEEFVEVAGKAGKYADDAIDATTALGCANKASGFSDPIGCFAAETEIELAEVTSGVVYASLGASPPNAEDARESRTLWASLLAGAAFGGYWMANRRHRREEEERLAQEVALGELFGTDDGGESDGDGVTELAFSRHFRHRASTGVNATVLSESIQDDGPTYFRAMTRIRYLGRSKEPQMNEYGSATAVKSSPNRCARRPRSRIGLIWLVGILGLAAWVGFAPFGNSRKSRATVSRVGAAPSVVDATTRTKRIADVVVGDRVKSENPTGEEDLSLGAEVEPTNWRKLALRASKRDGSWADVELLRPLSWIEEHEIEAGGTAPISVPECGIDGNADVFAIEPCPPIAPGKGRVVTGTFHHCSARVLDLEVEGLASPIVSTVNHLFWSADRERFVRADQLRTGEHLRSRDGLTVVIGASARRETIPVYNLEVHVDHVYHVSGAGVLVHNGTPNPCWDILAGRTGPALDNWRGRFQVWLKNEGLPRLPDDWDVHHRIPRPFENHPEFGDFDFHHPKNLRGVKGQNADVNVHQEITNAWEEFRRLNPNATRAEIERFANGIDGRFGSHWWGN